MLKMNRLAKFAAALLVALPTALAPVAAFAQTPPPKPPASPPPSAAPAPVPGPDAFTCRVMCTPPLPPLANTTSGRVSETAAQSRR